VKQHALKTRNSAMRQTSDALSRRAAFPPDHVENPSDPDQADLSTTTMMMYYLP